MVAGGVGFHMGPCWEGGGFTWVPLLGGWGFHMLEWRGFTWVIVGGGGVGVSHRVLAGRVGVSRGPCAGALAGLAERWGFTWGPCWAVGGFTWGPGGAVWGFTAVGVSHGAVGVSPGLLSGGWGFP